MPELTANTKHADKDVNVHIYTAKGNTKSPKQTLLNNMIFFKIFLHTCMFNLFPQHCTNTEISYFVFKI